MNGLKLPQKHRNSPLCWFVEICFGQCTILVCKVIDPKRAMVIVPPASKHKIRASFAPVAELVDASDSKSDSARSAGSIPARGTTFTFSDVRKGPFFIENRAFLHIYRSLAFAPLH